MLMLQICGEVLSDCSQLIISRPTNVSWTAYENAVNYLWMVHTEPERAIRPKCARRVVITLVEQRLSWQDKNTKYGAQLTLLYAQAGWMQSILTALLKDLSAAGV